MENWLQIPQQCSQRRRASCNLARAPELPRLFGRVLRRTAWLFLAASLAEFAALPTAKAAAPMQPEPGAAERRPQNTLSSRLLAVHNAVLGEITVFFGPRGEPSVPKGALIDMLLPLIDSDPDLLSRMQSIRDVDGNVSLAAVEQS